MSGRAGAPLRYLVNCAGCDFHMFTPFFDRTIAVNHRAAAPESGAEPSSKKYAKVYAKG